MNNDVRELREALFHRGWIVTGMLIMAQFRAEAYYMRTMRARSVTSSTGTGPRPRPQRSWVGAVAAATGADGPRTLSASMSAFALHQGGRNQPRRTSRLVSQVVSSPAR